MRDCLVGRDPRNAARTENARSLPSLRGGELYIDKSDFGDQHYDLEMSVHYFSELKDRARIEEKGPDVFALSCCIVGTISLDLFNLSGNALHRAINLCHATRGYQL